MLLAHPASAQLLWHQKPVCLSKARRGEALPFHCLWHEFVSAEQTPLLLPLPVWTSSPVLLRYEHSGAYVVFPEGCLDTQHWKEAGHKLRCLRTSLGSEMEAFDFEKPLYRAKFCMLIPCQLSCQLKGKVLEILFANASSPAACRSLSSCNLFCPGEKSASDLHVLQGGLVVLRLQASTGCPEEFIGRVIFMLTVCFPSVAD